MFTKNKLNEITELPYGKRADASIIVLPPGGTHRLVTYSTPKGCYGCQQCGIGTVAVCGSGTVPKIGAKGTWQDCTWCGLSWAPAPKSRIAKKVFAGGASETRTPAEATATLTRRLADALFPVGTYHVFGSGSARNTTQFKLAARILTWREAVSEGWVSCGPLRDMGHNDFVGLYCRRFRRLKFGVEARTQWFYHPGSSGESEWRPFMPDRIRDSAMVFVRVDYENNAELFWDALRDTHPAIAEKIQSTEGADLSATEWEIVKATEGFSDGPSYARYPVLEAE